MAEFVGWSEFGYETTECMSENGSYPCMDVTSCLYVFLMCDPG